MKSALIDVNFQLQYVSSWSPDPDHPGKYIPVYSPVPNGQRVAEVSAAPFPVAQPLYWLDCPDDIVADINYYDTVSQTFPLMLEPAPYPVTDVLGTQTL